MARNKVQFQRGLWTSSSSSSTEARKDAARRFSPGVGRKASRARRAGLGVLRAGEAFTVAVQRLPHPDVADGGHDLRGHQLDLMVWFRAMFHMTQTKQGISVLELSRRLDVSYKTARAMHHKLRQVSQGKPLDGRSRWTMPISAGSAAER